MRATIWRGVRDGVLTGMIGALLGVAVVLWGAILFEMFKALGEP